MRCWNRAANWFPGSDSVWLFAIRYLPTRPNSDVLCGTDETGDEFDNAHTTVVSESEQRRAGAEMRGRLTLLVDRRERNRLISIARHVRNQQPRIILAPDKHNPVH